MTTLEGKVAIVTGAARGIGLEYALRLAGLGAKVAVCDRDLASSAAYEGERNRLQGDDVAATIISAGAPDAYADQVDVTDATTVQAFVNQVVERWGRVDVVVCNAGGGAGDPTKALPSVIESEQAHDLLERNYFGTVNTIQACLGTMRHQGSGKIITIASIAGVAADRTAAGADYAVAKAAVVSYTRNLAQELAPEGITANAIAPGFIATEQWKVRFAEGDQSKLDAKGNTVPMRRLGTPTDCANIVEFFATPLSDYVTGQVLVVDGGLMLGPT